MTDPEYYLCILAKLRFYDFRFCVLGMRCINDSKAIRVKKLREIVTRAHKYAHPLSTMRRVMPIMHRFRFNYGEEGMRSAFWVGCAALLLSACSNEPVQQATAAHVTPGMRAAMSSSGQANCAMIGGSLSVARQLDGSAIGMCALPNGKRCSEQSLAVGSCGSY